MAVLLGGCQHGPAPDASGNRRVAVIPEGVDAWWFTVSRDGSTAAYAERRGSEAHLVVAERRLGPYS